MLNLKEIEKWDNVHHVTYLFMCIADSDYVITQDEINIILKKLEELFGKNENYSEIIEKATKKVLKQTELEKIETIRKVVPMFCKNVSLKNHFLKILEDIMASDRVISVEKITYRFIKKAIENYND